MKIQTVHPVLRAYDIERTLHFYVGYVGFKLDWQEGDGRGPTYAQVSLGPLELHLSTHHGDGTPGTVLVIEIVAIKTFLSELHSKDYPFMNPGLDPGPGENMLSTELLDPAGNMLRFFERGVTL